ncbi:carbohydrate kinase [Bacillus salipaludis]|uniref:Carbohydrate kinase n=1 Tax=Bacillus salipaludis TaxID=2547811 RepID=A0A4R5VKL8_9BACI|nr:carbohydrate kinase [Bacillus salipaludis]MDQ6598872.1 carbohydrate kinase [Bacillus salipaludis]MED1472653.1 carbohydrate kinase [Bacillus salipaludis]TDK58222.1 carbohydrate kinase [Bacillus salipaludis]
MKSLYSIGEVLIDFIPLQKGRMLKDVVEFERAPGGAPANVAATVARLGGKSSMISKLGTDSFGDFLVETLHQAGVKTDKILKTDKANTALAFVSLRKDGERDFSFYRSPSADLLMKEEEINGDWFTSGDILHFCSVDLVESPMKYAHIKAIKEAKQNGALISFDPNVRLPLWEKPEDCRETILSFIPKAHLIKISDEELSFITNIENEEEAIRSLFIGDVTVVIYTKGAKGAELYLKNDKFTSTGYKVDVQDTTGAGDAFIGGFLYQLLLNEVTPVNLKDTCKVKYHEFLQFANAVGALTTTGKGAISSIPDKEQVLKLTQG